VWFRLCGGRHDRAIDASRLNREIRPAPLTLSPTRPNSYPQTNHPAHAPRSIRAPRVGIRDRPPEPHGNEARDFLRKKLIGKEVNVKMEYTRKVQLTGGEGAPTGEVSTERGGF